MISGKARAHRLIYCSFRGVEVDNLSHNCHSLARDDSFTPGEVPVSDTSGYFLLVEEGITVIAILVPLAYRASRMFLDLLGLISVTSKPSLGMYRKKGPRDERRETKVSLSRDSNFPQDVEN